MRLPDYPAWSNQSVSRLGRVLASVLLFLFMLGLLGLVLAIVDTHSKAISVAPGSIFGILILLPFLYSMAVKGKYPRHWLPWK